jgi:hypothetical protein
MEGVDWREFRDGLFSYQYHGEEGLASGSFIGPYTREEKPAKPLHVDQLPPDLREVCKQVRFDSICFAEMKYLQPAEFLPCDGWSGVGYFTSDGNAVRPLPGREEEYHDFYWQFKGRLEQDLEGVRFEGLEEPDKPDKPKRRQGKPRRKRSDGG